MPRTEGLKPIGDSIRKIIDKVMEERKRRKKNRPIRTQPKLPGLKTGSVIEKKGATKLSAEQADKAIRQIVLDNPVLTKSANIIRKIDKLKAQGDLPVKKSKGGGADMGAKKKKYNRGPQSRNKMQPSRSMSIDTTTGISKMKDGGICRGAGAAIKGTKFQGVF